MDISLLTSRRWKPSVMTKVMHHVSCKNYTHDVRYSIQTGLDASQTDCTTGDRTDGDTSVTRSIPYYLAYKTLPRYKTPLGYKTRSQTRFLRGWEAVGYKTRFRKRYLVCSTIVQGNEAYTTHLLLFFYFIFYLTIE